MRQTCSQPGCYNPAITRVKSSGEHLCKQHKAELDAFMAKYIDQLARELAAMNDEELAAWMKEPV